MKLQGARTILTGAAGGIGRETAKLLAQRGARLLLVDRTADPLTSLCDLIGDLGGDARPVVADITQEEGRRTALSRAVEILGGVDLLINLAGISSFRCFESESPDDLDLLFRVNLLAPVQLTREVLPLMKNQGQGQIVNIGSTFGSIGFAYFTAYSSSKFGLRGFSEALRRELDSTGVGVTYVAPRAVRTPLNNDAVMRMAERVKMNMDDTAWVAQHITRAIERDKKDYYIGWPESLFVRINAILPRLVDGALRKQDRQAREFAAEGT